VGGSISNSSSIEVTNGPYFDVSALASYVVPAGKTLTGSGGIFGAVTVNGTVSPGETAGISIGPLNLNGNNLTLNGSANFRITRPALFSQATRLPALALPFTREPGAHSTGSTPLTNGDSFTLSAPARVQAASPSPAFPGVTFTSTRARVC